MCHLLELISTNLISHFYDTIRSITSETLGIGALAVTLMIKFGTKSLHEQIETNLCRQLNAMINNKFRGFSTPLVIDRRETLRNCVVGPLIDLHIRMLGYLQAKD